MCLLLDHIPHDEYSTPSFRDQLSWHWSFITIWVPNVKCERCHLKLMTAMSNEVHGVLEWTFYACGGALTAGKVNDGTGGEGKRRYAVCVPVRVPLLRPHEH